MKVKVGQKLYFYKEGYSRYSGHIVKVYRIRRDRVYLTDKSLAEEGGYVYASQLHEYVRYTTTPTQALRKRCKQKEVLRRINGTHI